MQHYQHPQGPNLYGTWAGMNTLQSAEMSASHEREIALMTIPRTQWNQSLSHNKLLEILYDNNCSTSAEVLQNYDPKDKLGEGTYGVVFKAIHRHTGEVVALKHIRFESQDEGTPSTAIREVALLRILKHNNIVSLLEIAHDDKAMVLVFEFLDQDLHNYIEGTKKGIDQNTICSFLFQLLTGLDYCHKNRIYHRDLKPQNLLINFQGELKLGDFGLARSGAVPINAFTHEVVTLWYRPPDVILGNNKYGPGIDLWGTGCIFAEMYIGKPLMPGGNALEQLVRIFRVCGGPNNPNNLLWDPTRFSLWADYEQKILSDPKIRDVLFSYPCLRKDYSRFIPSAAMDLLIRFLQYEESERISCEEALRHPFFAPLSTPGAEGTLNHHAMTNFNNSYGSMLPITNDEIYSSQYFTLQVLDSLNPNFLTEPYVNSCFENGFSLAPTPPQLNADTDNQDADEQMDFDLQSRSFEAQRALGRVAREFALWTGIEEAVILPNIPREESYHHLTFDHVDFQHMYKNKPESYLVQYGNELNGYIETSLIEMYESFTIGAVVSEFADYAWKYPAVNTIATGANDHFPIHGDEEGILEQKATYFEHQEKLDYYASRGRQLERQNIEYALTPLQLLSTDQNKFAEQVAAEKLFVEANWYDFRARMSSIPTDARQLLLMIMPTIHQNVALVQYAENQSYAQWTNLYYVLTEEQFNWLISQATGGQMLKSFYINQNSQSNNNGSVIMSDLNKNTAGVRYNEYVKLSRRAYMRNHRMEATKMYTVTHGLGLFDPANPLLRSFLQHQQSPQQMGLDDRK